MYSDSCFERGGGKHSELSRAPHLSREVVQRGSKAMCVQTCVAGQAGSQRETFWCTGEWCPPPTGVQLVTEGARVKQVGVEPYKRVFMW
jgi:hypothetical protein